MYFSHLADYLPLINQSVQDSIKRIKVHADNGTLLDMKSELHLVTMSSISKVICHAYIHTYIHTYMLLFRWYLVKI